MSGITLARPITSVALAATVAVTGLLATAPSASARDDWYWKRHHRNPYVEHNVGRRDLYERRYDRRYTYGHRYRQRSDGAWVGAGIAGLAAGAIIGGALAPRVYTPPRVVYPSRGGYQPWSNAWYDYCENRYRSFDPQSGTFLGYDGRRHFCR